MSPIHKSVFVVLIVIAMIGAGVTVFAQNSCDPAVNYLVQGNQLYDQGDFTAATSSYTCAIQLTGSASAYNWRGNAYRQQGNYQQAIADYDKAIELNADLAIAYNNRGWAYFKLDDLDRALEDYNRAIELDPELAYAYNNRGLIYQLRNEPQRAFEDFNQALRLNITPSSWTQHNLEQLALAYPDSLPVLTATRVTDSTPSPSLHEVLAAAHSYYQAGDYEQAIEYYTQALELNPTGCVAACIYGKRGSAYAELGQFEAALADANSAVEIDPEHGHSYLARGIILTQLGEFEAAAQDFMVWIDEIRVETIEHDVITAGEPVTIAMSQGAVYHLPFDGTAGQVITVTAQDSPDDELTVDPLLVLLSPDGEPLIGDDDMKFDILDSMFANFTLPIDGTYTVVVSHAGGGSAGEIVVELTEAS